MIQVENLSVAYPDKTIALQNIDFSIAGSESVAIIGANGAGKSTLLLTLMGIIPACAGRITIGNIPVNHKNRDQIHRLLGMVFQNPDDQLFMPTIFEDIAFGLKNGGLSDAEATERVTEVLNELHIPYLRERSPLKLSGGEKRTAAIATVLAMRPRAILFDEPSAFLDPRARRNLIHLLRGLPQAKIIATHDLPLAIESCERVLILKKGALFADGNPKTLLKDKKLMEGCGLEVEL